MFHKFFGGTHSLHKFIQKNQQKSKRNRSKLITFKTRGTQNKALKMKNRKSKCLNYLTALDKSEMSY
jgi:hypothetical protein